jgi:hypothetical protein
MRRATTILFAVSLLMMPSPPRADSGPSLPPPTVAIPFDDVDPAVLQMEVTQQISAFLHNLDAYWGTTPDTLRNRMQGTIERDDIGALVYARTLAAHDVLEGYEFREGSLVRGRYVCLQRPVNGLNEFIDYYTAVKESLAALYGAPVEDRTIWNNDLYLPLPDYWGVAVQIGHLRYAALWETADGTISIELTGNHHSRLTIEYRNRILADDSQTA